MFSKDTEYPSDSQNASSGASRSAWESPVSASRDDSSDTGSAPSRIWVCETVEDERGPEEYAPLVGLRALLVALLDRDRGEDPQRNLAAAHTPTQLQPGAEPDDSLRMMPRS